MPGNQSAADSKTVLVLCPTHRDERELTLIGAGGRHALLFHDYASLALEDLVTSEPAGREGICDAGAEIDFILHECGRHRLEAVVSTDDYPGSTLASIVAHELHLPGVAPWVNLLCQHKFYAREAQQAIVPEAVPAFQLLDGRHVERALEFPLFIKPVKSFFSVGAYRVDAFSDLPGAAKRASLPGQFFEPFAVLLKRWTGLDFGPHTVLAEDLLAGCQATLEGYVLRGQVHILGVVDSIMVPGTVSFQRFEYPSELPEVVQERMAAIATRLMACIGFDNGMFNIEFMYDDRRDLVSIIEVNPRMSSQFADLFEKVDGTNSYSILLELAQGQEPRRLRRAGRHEVAASCVLRVFENQRVIKLPSTSDIEAVMGFAPDARVEILATEGSTLSQELQDSHSYRYGLVNIGAHDRHEVLEIFEECKKRLKFEFEAAA